MLVVVLPEFPYSVAPGLEGREKGVGLDDVTIRRERKMRAAVDFVAKELDVLAAGGLVVEIDLDPVRSGRNVEVDVVPVVVGAPLSRVAELAGRNRKRAAAPGLVIVQFEGRDSIVLLRV